MNSVLRCDDKVFKFVHGDEQFGVRFKAGYDGGRNGRSGGGPGLGGVGVLLEVSAGLKDE